MSSDVCRGILLQMKRQRCPRRQANRLYVPWVGTADKWARHTTRFHPAAIPDVCSCLLVPVWARRVTRASTNSISNTLYGPNRRQLPSNARLTACRYHVPPSHSCGRAAWSYRGTAPRLFPGDIEGRPIQEIRLNATRETVMRVLTPPSPQRIGVQRTSSSSGWSSARQYGASRSAPRYGLWKRLSWRVCPLLTATAVARLITRI